MTFSTPDLCDEYPDRIQVLEPLFKDFGGNCKFHGEIVTVKCHEDNSMVKHTLSTQGQGQVLVVDGGGSLRCALLGDLLGAMAIENGWQGVLVYGCVRDVEILKDMALGVRALEAYPLKSEKRGEGECNVIVRFAGVRFEPGDYLYADENGLIVASEKLDLKDTG